MIRTVSPCCQSVGENSSAQAAPGFSIEGGRLNIDAPEVLDDPANIVRLFAIAERRDLRRFVPDAAVSEDVLARLGQESAELRHDKADRSTLANLLTEMAMRLNNELTLPGIDDGRRG